MIFKCKWYNSITILQIISNLSIIVASNEKCTTKKGTCIPTSECTGNNIYISGKCDGPADIRCCFENHHSLSSKIIDIIKSFEGCRLTAYKDTGGVWTIGYGTTSADKKITGTDIYKGLQIDEKTAENWFKLSMNEKYGPNVEWFNYEYNWTQNEYDALCSFAYNIGSINNLVDNGNRSKSEIFKSMLKHYYAKVNNVSTPLKGLVRRRAAEAALFTGCDYSTYVNYGKTYTIINNEICDYIGEFYINKLRELGDNVSLIGNTNTNSESSTPKSCNDGKLTGVCINKNQCDTVNNFVKPGLCLDQPNEIKCCLPKMPCTDKQENYENSGICILKEQCDENTNTIVSGLCKGGNDIKCCIPKPISTNDRCGPSNNNAMCPNDQCCSSAGWCDITEAHCGTGCQSKFGKCDSAQSENEKTNLGLALYAIEQEGKPYWYGTYGQIGTQALYEAKKKDYSEYYTANDFQDQIKQKVKVHDCSGLIKGYLWSETSNSEPIHNPSQDLTASMMYSESTEKGTSSTFRKIIGQLVYKKNSKGVIHHVGIYIGNDKVIEAKGHSYGVIISDYDESWVYWSQCPFIINNTEHYCDDPDSASIASHQNYTFSKKIQDKFCEIVIDDNLNKGTEDKSDTDGTGNFKPFTCLNILIMMLSSFMILRIYIIF